MSKDLRSAGFGYVGGKQRPGKGGNDDSGSIVPATGKCSGDPGRAALTLLPPFPPARWTPPGGRRVGGSCRQAGRGAEARQPRVRSNHPKVPSRHILDLILPRVSAPQLPPLSLTLSLWTRSYLPPPILLPLVLCLFLTLHFQDSGTAPEPTHVPPTTTIPPKSARMTTTMTTIMLGGERGIVAIIRSRMIEATAPSVGGTG
jgi:hypothetical protein